MKTLTTILLLLIVGVVTAQQKPAQFVSGLNTRGVARDQFQVDSLLYIPLTDTLKAPGRAGVWVYKSSNDKNYYYDGMFWRLIISSVDTANMLSHYLRAMDTTNKWLPLGYAPTLQQVINNGNVLSKSDTISLGVNVLSFQGTSALRLPVGTTAQRPGSPVAGYQRYNTDSTAIEFYNGSAWQKVGSSGGSSSTPTLQQVLTAGNQVTVSPQLIKGTGLTVLQLDSFTNVNIRHKGFFRIQADGGQQSGVFTQSNIVLTAGDSVTVSTPSTVFSVLPPTALYGSVKLRGIGAPVSDSNLYYLLAQNKTTGDVKPAYWIAGGGGGGGTDNTNIGSGYRWLNPSTQGIRTAFPGYGVLVDSTSNSNGLTIKVDSATLASYFVRIKDSNNVYITPTYFNTHQITSNPGVYFSPAEALDPSFIVIASCIPRTNSYSFGTPIVWSILDHSSQHNSSFMDSVYGGGSNQLVVRYPPVKTVLNTTFVTDESFAGALANIGPSTDLTTSNAYVYQPAIISVRLTGNGGSSWTKSSSNALGGYFDVFSVFSAGATVFNIVSGINIEYEAISIQYLGSNNYHIKRLYSGLGGYNVKFLLVDQFGNTVTDNPTSNDEILITGGGMASLQLNMTTWNVANSWMPGFANWWIDGIFECWEVAAATSSSSIQVRWQNYPAATNYKIYRATSLYGARTLVHTGTDNSFIDTGLSAGTLYWYFMVATLSGVDTDITYFRTSTNP